MARGVRTKAVSAATVSAADTKMIEQDVTTKDTPVAPDAQAPETATTEAVKPVAEKVQADQDKDTGGDSYPKTIAVTNTSNVSLADPVSGKYLASYSITKVVLQDEEHAKRVHDSFKNLLTANHLPAHALAVAVVA